MKIRFLDVFFVAVVTILVQSLTSCSWNSEDSKSDAAPESRVLMELGRPFDASTVLSLECAKAQDLPKSALATGARYPLATPAFRGWPSFGSVAPGDPYLPPMQLRSDRNGGFVVSHPTAGGGAMFRVSAQGDKLLMMLPYSPVFDVAADGGIWFSSDAALFLGSPDGTIRRLADASSSQTLGDGPLGSTSLGSIRLIAAGRDKIYLLIEDGVITAPQIVSLNRSLKVLSRTAQGGWMVQGVPLFDGLATNDVISSIKVGPADELFVLLNQPFHQLVSQQTLRTGGVASEYVGMASVQVLGTNGRWALLGSKSYSLSITPNTTHGYLVYAYSLDASDVSVAPNGTVWVGGAGAIYSVDAAHGWRLMASPLMHGTDEIGKEGLTTVATFAHAGQLLADDRGLTFYDGETCQIRRLEDGQITTISGPVLSSAGFAGAGFIGLGKSGELIFAYADGADLSVSFNRDRYRSLFSLAKYNLNNPLAEPERLDSVASIVGQPICRAGTSYWAGHPSCLGAPPGTPAGAWLGMAKAGPVARIGSNLYLGQEAMARTVVSSTLSWPGILDGDAPSGPSGVHVDTNHLYLFGTMRTDPPADLSTYHEIRLYEVDLTTGIANPVAGKSIASAIFSGKKVDLAPVIPSLGGWPAFVQHRRDGGFWLVNGKEAWILDRAGELRRVAGLSTTGSQGLDGVGDGASFALISSIRVLADDRLLIVDQGAHAVRVVSDGGIVSTIVGRLNGAGQALGALPAGLDNPLDVFPVGRDLYIVALGNRNLLLAKNAL